jgi:hypothetical protein
MSLLYIYIEVPAGSYIGVRARKGTLEHVGARMEALLMEHLSDVDVCVFLKCLVLEEVRLII